MSDDDPDHEAVLARITELEAENARLVAENEALRAAGVADKVLPRDVGRHLYLVESLKRIGVVLAILLLTALVRGCW